MQFTSKFTIAIHIITAIDYFQGATEVTSAFLAGSVGTNPVVVRNVMGNLKEAGIIAVSRGKRGITLARELRAITFYDVYQAVDCASADGLFHFHENPNINCPIGRTIRRATDNKLRAVQRAMENALKEITLAEVVAAARAEIERKS